VCGWFMHCVSPSRQGTIDGSDLHTCTSKTLATSNSRQPYASALTWKARSTDDGEVRASSIAVATATATARRRRAGYIAKVISPNVYGLEHMCVDRKIAFVSLVSRHRSTQAPFNTAYHFRLFRNRLKSEKEMIDRQRNGLVRLRPRYSTP
jgi:hypothetical protein